MSAPSTILMIAEEDLKLFEENFYCTRMGSLWRAYNRYTHESASPIYNNKDKVIYYVLQELKQEMEEQIETLLGGSNVTTNMDDDSTFRSRFYVSEPRDGAEEI